MSYTLDAIGEALRKSLEEFKGQEITAELLQQIHRKVGQVLPPLNDSAEATGATGAPDTADLRYNLQPSDQALLIEASCLQELKSLKSCLSEFNFALYESSAIYEKARSLEPSLFFPRVYLVEILSTVPGATPAKVTYVGRHANNVKSLSGLDTMLKFSAEDLFISSEDIGELKKIYYTNTEKTLAWLTEMERVKCYEITRKLQWLRENIDCDQSDSFKALESFQKLTSDN